MTSLLSQLTEISALLDQYPDLSEVMCNPDGNVWIEDHGNIINPKLHLESNRVDSIIRLLAGHYDLVVNREHPSLSVKLPVFHGGRFQALVPPVVEAPMFSIRFPPRKILTLENLLAMETIDSEKFKQLEDAVLSKKTILIAGGTGSGKTTILNALLKLVTDERLIIIEDNPEIRASSFNTVQILTNRNYSARDALKDSLRLRPDRIIVGEIRDGATAIDFLKAAMTGHPGSMSSIHSSSGTDDKDVRKNAEERLYTLMQEEVVTPSKELIRNAITMVVFVKKVFLPPSKVIRQVTKIE